MEEALCFGWIDSTVKKDAKKEETRQRRIKRAVEMCCEGRKPGMM